MTLRAVLPVDRVAKLLRDARKRARRRMKGVRESSKAARAGVKHGRDDARDALRHAYAGGVRASRYWDRLRRRTWAGIALDVSVRRELRAAAAGGGPVIVGPWLSEVGYEALYWVPFVRWFADHYGVGPERLVVVSRGGAGAWYGDVAGRSIELLDLYTPEEFSARNAARQAAGDQKQLRVGPFDEEILERVRAELRAPDARVCHPSAMFRLLRHYWLGTDSLQQVLDYTRYAPIAPAAVALPELPARFAAVKFYSGRALPDSPANRAALRQVLEQVASTMPVVALSTGLALDEHEDFLFRDLPGVIWLDGALAPRDNLAVQTEVIRRATQFIGTCGSLAWLGPMVGTPTLAVYADAHFLTPHLYAAGLVYPGMGAARFTPVDLHALQALGRLEPQLG